jgi:hypothetical protein
MPITEGDEIEFTLNSFRCRLAQSLPDLPI